MKVNNFDQKLAEQIGNLEQERLPERDLWRGIELGIEQPHENTADKEKRSFPKVVAMAASLGLIVSLSWVGLNQSPSTDMNELLAQQGQQLVEALSDQHQAQKNALLVEFSDTPAATENWQQQLTELDEAAVAIKTALQEDPNNKALLRMLQSVYHQQIELIERVHAPRWREI